VRQKAHARFWIGGGGSNPVADHTLSVPVDANTMCVLTRIITALALMPTASVGCGSAGTSNCAPIWSMKPSGRKSVGSSPIQSGWNRNIDDAWCRRNRRRTS